LFVQLNTGEEPQKAGVAPSEADAFITSCRDNYGLSIFRPDVPFRRLIRRRRRIFALTANSRRAQRLKEFVDGYERGLRDRDPVGATQCPRGSRFFGIGSALP